MDCHYRIRPYRPEDLPRLQEITAATFEGVSIDRNMERLLGPFGPADWRDRKVAAIAEDCRLQPDGIYVAEAVADQGGEDASAAVAGVVGYVTTRLQLAASIGWIPNLAVDPLHQGQGLGRALLETALAFFRERGMAVAKIETLEQNPIGQKLYPQIGFSEVARQIHFAMRLDENRNPDSE
jgi:ribosomal protein S18 acetylase RimI-like enzyme